MNTVMSSRLGEAQLSSKALRSAGHELGLKQTEVATIIGRDRSSIHRYGIDPKTKPGESALLWIRVYRSLFALMGGDSALMKHWMHTRNLHSGASQPSRAAASRGW